jgi:hypothetical protein
MEQLRWYLEHFLDYPFDPEIGHANYVLDALQSWGTQAFNALFDRRDADKWLADSEILQIRSDDPHILSWPWEALFDPQRSYLAHERQIERRLNHLPDPPPRRNLPNDCVNILLVVARPFARDVRYRSIARPLVELIRSRNLPAHVDVLRPPTFDQLREHLRAHPGYYHALHFDGHGAYGNGAGEYSRHKLQGPQGSLIFEDAAGDPDPKSARDLSALLHEYAVPAVVLNACQSAMLDSKAGDAFASVATALLQSGMRSVVAMAYSLYVSGAQVFLPAFYRRLFEAGSVAEAVSARRLAAAGALPAGPARLQLRHLGAGKPACRVATPGDATTRPSPTASSAPTVPFWKRSARCTARPRRFWCKAWAESARPPWRAASCSGSTTPAASTARYGSISAISGVANTRSTGWERSSTAGTSGSCLTNGFFIVPRSSFLSGRVPRAPAPLRNHSSRTVGRPSESSQIYNASHRARLSDGKFSPPVTITNLMEQLPSNPNPHEAELRPSPPTNKSSGAHPIMTTPPSFKSRPPLP